MSKKEKLIHRFLLKPKDFKYSEASRLLKNYGYYESSKGKTSGSRVAFIQEKMKRTILLLKPHKGILKPYQLDEIKSELMKAGFLKRGERTWQKIR